MSELASQSEPPAVAGGLTSEQQILTDTGFYWRERDGIKVLVSRPLEETGFANGFSTRLGGVSAFSLGNDLNLAGFDEDEAENIYENRRRFLTAFDGNYRLATVWQVHGDTIKTVDTIEDIGNSEDRADALVSDLCGILVGAKTADCVPILLGDPKTGAFAAVHAGWRGTVRSIVRKAVEQMHATFGTNATDIIAAIGPAACGRNYEVGGDVISEFGENFVGSDKYFTATRDGHALADLHLANRDQLTAIGVNNANIYTAPFCTMERSDLFFSYRLEKKTFGKTGRLLSVIGRN
ncbi:MAG: peptidoglycan editing factor PgeF [Pyrinomonadaceae bacterium]